MVDPAAASVAPASAAAPSADDPTAPHAPGIYMMAKGKDGVLHLTKLEHVLPKEGKTSGVLAHAFTYGIAKAHFQAVIDGPKAAIEVADTNPTFYAYIPEDNTTFGGSSITIKDFALVKFDVKGDTRVVNTMTMGFASASTGTDAKARQGFTSEPVKPGIYKLTLAGRLRSGNMPSSRAALQPLPPASRTPAPSSISASFPTCSSAATCSRRTMISKAGAEQIRTAAPPYSRSLSQFWPFFQRLRTWRSVQPVISAISAMLNPAK